MGDMCITREELEKLISEIPVLRAEDIPSIDLYMDQVTSFMEEKLGKPEGGKKDEKVLTKTMINNYAKNDLMPPPVKKKYSKDHLLILTYIYYFKNFLTMNDIKNLTKKLGTEYFNNPENIRLEEIYSRLLSSFGELKELFIDSVQRCDELAGAAYENLGAKDPYLRKFMLTALLGMDVYLKKQLIESMIDDEK